MKKSMEMESVNPIHQVTQTLENEDRGARDELSSPKSSLIQSPSDTADREVSVLKSALLAVLKLVKGQPLDKLRDVIGEEAILIMGSDFPVKDVIVKSRKTKPVEPTDTEADLRAEKSELEEKARQRLRDAVNEVDVISAIDEANRLGMEFEAALGERKLAKIKSSSTEATTVSSRE